MRAGERGSKRALFQNLKIEENFSECLGGRMSVLLGKESLLLLF